MNTSRHVLLSLSLAVVSLPSLATGAASARVSGLSATVTDDDPLDGIDARLVLTGQPRVYERNQFNLKTGQGEAKGLVEIDRPNLDAVTLTQASLPAFGGVSFASFSGGWTGTLDSRSQAEVGDVESVVNNHVDFTLSPHATVIFSVTLDYRISIAGEPSGGNRPFSSADARILFSNNLNGNLNTAFVLGADIEPAAPDYALRSSWDTRTYTWRLANSTDSFVTLAFDATTAARTLSTVSTVPEVPTAPLLLAGIGVVALARRYKRKDAQSNGTAEDQGSDLQSGHG